MTFSITLSDAAFTKAASRAAPYWADCSALYLFGVSEALSKRNMKTGVDATVVGAPVYGDNYATLGPTAGFVDAAAARTNPYTHCVVTTIGSGNNLYAGHVSSTGAVGGAIARNNMNAAAQVSGGLKAVTPYQSAAGFNFLATSHDGANAKVHAALAGAITTVTGAYAATPAAQSLRIGGMGLGASFNIAAEMSFTRALTNAEVAEALAYLAFLLSKRGVIVA